MDKEDKMDGLLFWKILVMIVMAASALIAVWGHNKNKREDAAKAKMEANVSSEE